MEILKRKFSLKEINSKDIRVGDVIELPEFLVPETTIDGINKLGFAEQIVKDTATVYDIRDNKLYLVFDHALFQSAIDMNNEYKWEQTQLQNYLSTQFEPAMRYGGIPAEKVSLLTKEELFGSKALPFFKNGKNRIVFDKRESKSILYWLNTHYTETASRYFCFAENDGDSVCFAATCANCFVRPCFIIQQRQM